LNKIATFAPALSSDDKAEICSKEKVRNRWWKQTKQRKKGKKCLHES